MEGVEITITAEQSECNHPRQSDAIISSCIVATLGFSCWFGWDLSGFYAPASPLVPYLTTTEIAVTRIPFLLALIASLAVAHFGANWVFNNRTWFFPLACSVFAVPLIIAFLGHILAGALPHFLHIISWAAFGIGQGAFLLYWASYFSLIPTRYTPLVITASSVLGTLLFLVIANLNSPYLSLLVAASFVACSILSATWLYRRISRESILPTDKFNRFSSFTFGSALSVGTHYVAYGFTIVTLFTLGPEATAIGCASGILGTLACLLWYRFGSKIEVGSSILQRITLPPIIVALLALPYVDDTGVLLCCCLLNVALSHFVVMGWINTTVANSEFQFHPIASMTLSRIPGWIGFFAGVAYALFVYFFNPLSGASYQIAMIVIVVLITSASAVYGMDDSLTKRRLSEILSKRIPEEEEVPSKKTSKFFQLSCDKVAQTYELSKREAEVFSYLARGRNAEYISEQLMVSSSTIKTHIYHIYQKMGISSQQRLMDIVENTQKTGH